MIEYIAKQKAEEWNNDHRDHCPPPDHDPKVSKDLSVIPSLGSSLSMFFPLIEFLEEISLDLLVGEFLFEWP